MKISQDSLYIPYRKRSYLIIQSLMLNNYEVNLIDKFYLLLWDRNKHQNYIPLETVLSDFNSHYHGIVQTFFHYFQIYYDDYFIFVCAFAFCNLSQILYILLASCQLYPAKYITKDEINQFLKSTKIAHCSYEMLSRIARCKTSNNNHANTSLSPKSLESPSNNNDNSNSSSLSGGTAATSSSSTPTEQYYLKSFVDFILSCDNYRKLVSDIKKTLINVIITPLIYSSIVKRLNFFTNYLNNNNASIPKESCTAKTLRILFSNRPEPYHYDFRLQSITPNAFNDVVRNIILNYRASGTLSPALEMNKRKIKKHTKEKEEMNKTNSNNMLMLSDRMHHRTRRDIHNLRKADSENNMKSPEKQLKSISPLESSYPKLFINKITPVQSAEESEK